MRERRIYISILRDRKETHSRKYLKTEVHEAKYVSSSKRSCRVSRLGKLRKLV